MQIGAPISIHTDMNKFLLTLSLLFAFPIGQCRAAEWYIGKNPLREATFEKGILQDGNYREGLSVVNLTETGIGIRFWALMLKTAAARDSPIIIFLYIILIFPFRLR